MNNVLMFTTGKNVQTTPREFFMELNAEFNFIHDAAAERGNSKCGSQYYGPDQVHPEWRDALTASWPTWGNVFCNPPYQHPLCAHFIAKAAAERKRGVTTVMLLAARTDTKAFHTYIWDRKWHRPRRGVKLRFVYRRLKFNNAKDAAPFPSMVVLFKGKPAKAMAMREAA